MRLKEKNRNGHWTRKQRYDKVWKKHRKTKGKRNKDTTNKKTQNIETLKNWEIKKKPNVDDFAFSTRLLKTS